MLGPVFSDGICSSCGNEDKTLTYTQLICISGKLAAMIMAVILIGDQLLITIGDAVASFLRQPESLSEADTQRRTSPSGASRCRTGPWLRLALMGFFCVHVQRNESSVTKFNLDAMFKLGLGNMPATWTTSQSDHIIRYPDAENPSTSYTSGAVLANLPLIALSFWYLIFNNYITRLFVALEFRSFSTRRRGLLVSKHSKDTKQRKVHFLQIPLRHSLLNIAVFVLLHTLLSQTLFLRRVYAVYPQSFDNPNDIGKKLVPMIEYSPLASLAFASLSTALVVTGVIIGLLKIDWRFPNTGGDSLAIGAACHPPDGISNTEDGELAAGTAARRNGTNSAVFLTSIASEGRKLLDLEF
ncbi:Uu.00g047140.m01.CDS01 [Anthostomella pinea]|uniref:Uu.00g047140.m01.CDS01 n=1 Tax=Anthostomella pinea TaxID=933095 RepID=A0AAI8VBI1_9PEZI|nr:Uu.00g047140.m01.CDS01 [Anthostomella pinea]